MKELDVVRLKDDKEVTILEMYEDGALLVEDLDNQVYMSNKADVIEVTFVA